MTGSEPSAATDLDLVRLAQAGDIDAFGELGTWLLSITWRKAIDRRKSISRWLRTAVSPSRSDTGEDPFDQMERVATSSRSQEDTFVDEELQRNVMRLIRTLPGKLRDALLLAGTGEHTYEEISQILGAPLGTVKWRVSEARRVLKKKLAALGYAYE
ncbi:MAG: RNA polymerase sigma factor [Acidobacteria bacterium]|nr:RNA polymerase sigma factor [Acidobacteriota bacterium]